MRANKLTILHMYPHKHLPRSSVIQRHRCVIFGLYTSSATLVKLGLGDIIYMITEKNMCFFFFFFFFSNSIVFALFVDSLKTILSFFFFFNSFPPHHQTSSPWLLICILFICYCFDVVTQYIIFFFFYAFQSFHLCLTSWWTELKSLHSYKPMKSPSQIRVNYSSHFSLRKN